MANEQWTTIKSPNYPDEFQEGQECSWLFVAPASQIVELQFVGVFDLYCKERHSLCMDYVEIRNGSDFANTGMRCAERTHSCPTSTHTGIAAMAHKAVVCSRPIVKCLSSSVRSIKLDVDSVHAPRRRRRQVGLSAHFPMYYFRLMVVMVGMVGLFSNMWRLWST